MYNGNKIKELLKERGLTGADLLAHLGVKENGSITRFVGGDIKASRLEQIAEYFGVSVAYFFDTERDFNFAPDGALSTTGGTAIYNAGKKDTAKIKELNNLVKSLQVLLSAKESALKDKDAIISEKDKRIDLLEKMLRMCEQNDPQNSDKIGAKSDKNSEM